MTITMNRKEFNEAYNEGFEVFKEWFNLINETTDGREEDFYQDVFNCLASAFHIESEETMFDILNVRYGTPRFICTGFDEKGNEIGTYEKIADNVNIC